MLTTQTSKFVVRGSGVKRLLGFQVVWVYG